MVGKNCFAISFRKLCKKALFRTTHLEALLRTNSNSCHSCGKCVARFQALHTLATLPRSLNGRCSNTLTRTSGGSVDQSGELFIRQPFLVWSKCCSRAAEVSEKAAGAREEMQQPRLRFVSLGAKSVTCTYENIRIFLVFTHNSAPFCNRRSCSGTEVIYWVDRRNEQFF